MPDWSTTTPVVSYTGTVTMKGAGGRTASVEISGAGAISQAQLANIRAALGNVSNAVPVATNLTQKHQTSLSADAPFDESYSDVATKLLLVFQDTTDMSFTRIGVPAPDEQFFSADGETAIAPDSAGAAGSPGLLLYTLVTAVNTAINGGTAGRYVYVGGLYSARARSAKSGLRAVVPSVEPGPTDNPSGAPDAG